MLQRPEPYLDPVSYLLKHNPELPVHFFAVDALRERLGEFLSGFPGLVTYAVKANPSDEVLTHLVDGGLAGFDVASPEEIALVQSIGPQSDLHYNNPVRSEREIQAGLRAGVRSWSVDDASELDKLIRQGIGADHEVSVRFKLPVAGAHYNFGEKFGATETEAAALLQRVARAGFRTALTFHVGTQCGDPQAYATYIAAAINIAKAAGVSIKRLNVGGGFPSVRTGQGLNLQKYFEVIHAAVSGFETRPDLICEPGRGLVADAFSYGVCVKSVRAGRVYLNDGIYGGLSEFPSMVIPDFRVLGPDHERNGKTSEMVVFGPTCDSLDQLPHSLHLPDDLCEGDWILFRSMGAYLTGVTTRFNGYGNRETVQVRRL